MVHHRKVTNWYFLLGDIISGLHILVNRKAKFVCIYIVVIAQIVNLNFALMVFAEVF